MYYIHLFINTILIVRICSNNLESLESGTKLASRPTTTKCGASRVILIDLSGDKVTGKPASPLFMFVLAPIELQNGGEHGGASDSVYYYYGEIMLPTSNF